MAEQVWFNVLMAAYTDRKLSIEDAISAADKAFTAAKQIMPVPSPGKPV